MKKLKKLKVLVSLFSIFSLLTLTSVSAMDSKNELLNKEIYSNNEEISNKNLENLKYEKKEEKTNNFNIPLDEEEKEPKIEKNNAKENDAQKQRLLKTDIVFRENNYLLIGQKTKNKVLEEKNETIETENKKNNVEMPIQKKEEQEKLMPRKEINEEELKDLSKKFFEKDVDFNYNVMFEKCMNWLGYCSEKNELDIGRPNILINPHYFKYKMLPNGKLELTPYYLNVENASLFPRYFNSKSEFNRHFFDYQIIDLFRGFFSSDFLRMFVIYYRHCFREYLNSPIIMTYGDKKYEINKEVLNSYVKYFYNFCSKKLTAVRKYEGYLESFIKMFFSSVYIKSLFLSEGTKYANNFFTRRDGIERLQLFAKSLSTAIKCKFKNDGSIERFELNFDINKLDEGDKQFLKSLYDVINSKDTENILYYFYTIAYAFLNNVEFWNKIIGIIICNNCFNARANKYQYNDSLKEIIHMDPYECYSLTDQVIRSMLDGKIENIKNIKMPKINKEDNNLEFNIGFKDEDFYNICERFIKIFSNLRKKNKKGLFYKTIKNNMGVGYYDQYISEIFKKNNKDFYNEEYYNNDLNYTYDYISLFKQNNEDFYNEKKHIPDMGNLNAIPLFYKKINKKTNPTFDFTTDFEFLIQQCNEFNQSDKNIPKINNATDDSLEKSNRKERVEKIVSNVDDIKDRSYWKNSEPFKKKNCVREFNELDKTLEENLYEDFLNRFNYSFGISPNCEFIGNNFKDFGSSDKSTMFKIFGNNSFSVSKCVMLECLDRAVRIKKIKEECIALIRYMFNYYLIEGFIKTYGNDEDETNVEILRLAEYFDSILDVFFKKNKCGKYELKLGFKKLNPSYHDTKIIYDVVKNKNFFNITNNKNEESEKNIFIYRMFLTARSFIHQDKFWNDFLAYLICNNQFNAAKNFFSDSRALYDEYKKLNEDMLGDNFFSNVNNYTNYMKIGSTNISCDKNFIDFVSGRNLKGIEKIIENGSENFIDYFFNIKKDHIYILREIFKHKMASLAKKLFEDSEGEIYSKLKKTCDPQRYCNAFLYNDLKSLLSDLFLICTELEKSVDFKNCKEYGEILKNKKITNEFITFIERFFYFYMNELVKDEHLYDLFNDNNILNLSEVLRTSYNMSNPESMFKFVFPKVSDNVKKIVVPEKIVDDAFPILKWYSRIFDIKVKDSKLDFNFNLGHFDNIVDGNIKDFFNAYCLACGDYNPRTFISNLEKNFLNNNLININGIFDKRNLGKMEFLYKTYVDAFSFLASENYWNQFFCKIVLNNLKFFDIQRTKNNFYFRYNPFILDEEYFDFLEKKDMEKQ